MDAHDLKDVCWVDVYWHEDRMLRRMGSIIPAQTSQVVGAHRCMEDGEIRRMSHESCWSHDKNTQIWTSLHHRPFPNLLSQK